MRIPRSPAALAAVLPDAPRWVETRSLLLGGAATLRVGRAGDAGLVLDPAHLSAALVGRADQALLREVLADAPAAFELVVQMDALPGARRALSGWTVREVVVHSLRRPFPRAARPEPGVVVSAPPQARWLAGLPADVREDAAGAAALAVRVQDGAVVAVCAAGDVTETLWDVGIDTLEGHRRQGHAGACFRALAAEMARAGRQPVWCAFADYVPSMALAGTLGFWPVDRIAVLSAPADTARGRSSALAVSSRMLGGRP